MFEFQLPDLGEGIAEGEILKWHVNEGDTVAEDAALLVVARNLPRPATTRARLAMARQISTRTANLFSMGMSVDM